MTRTIARLASTKVTALLKAGDKKAHADGGNLYLQITGAGTGSWLFRYTEKGSGAGDKKPQERWLGLGSVNTIGLAAARERAKTLRVQLLDGHDPASVRKEARAGVVKSGKTFTDAAELYLAAYEPGWRSAVHARQWRSTLRDYVTPAIGLLAVASIETAHVEDILKPIWHTKTETASRVRQRIEVILDYAKAKGWRTGDNPALWKGHLQNLLAAKQKIAPVKHHAALDWKAVPAFVTTLSKRQGSAAKALSILLLTATRSAEARGATWGEIDLDRAVWTIPAGRMKAQKEHVIPLADAAVRILSGIRPAAPDPATLVFIGGKPGAPLSDVSLSKLLPSGITIHGFRSTFRTWGAERTDFSREVLEMALAHRLGDAVEKAYSRGDQLEKRKPLMAAWAEFCFSDNPAAAVGDNVVPMRLGSSK